MNKELDYFEFKNGACISFHGLVSIGRIDDCPSMVHKKVEFSYAPSGKSEITIWLMRDSLQEFEEEVLVCKTKWHEFRNNNKQIL